MTRHAVCERAGVTGDTDIENKQENASLIWEVCNRRHLAPANIIIIIIEPQRQFKSLADENLWLCPAPWQRRSGVKAVKSPLSPFVGEP